VYSDTVSVWHGYYFRRHLASKGIVSLCITLSRCVCVRWAAYITYWLHAALVSAVKVMRCIQYSLVTLLAASCWWLIDRRSVRSVKNISSTVLKSLHLWICFTWNYFGKISQLDIESSSCLYCRHHNWFAAYLLQGLSECSSAESEAYDVELELWQESRLMVCPTYTYAFYHFILTLLAGNWPKVRELSGKKSCQGKLFIVNFVI